MRSAESESALGGSDASDGVREVRSADPECGMRLGRARTGVSESNEGPVEASEIRTLRTPLNPSGYEECSLEMRRKYQVRPRSSAPSVASGKRGFSRSAAQGVRGVREVVAAVEPPKPAAAKVRLPFFTPGGTLQIPGNSPERYHWWKLDGERLHVKEIVAELFGQGRRRLKMA